MGRQAHRIVVRALAIIAMLAFAGELAGCRCHCTRDDLEPRNEAATLQGVPGGRPKTPAAPTQAPAPPK
jgi:hypothetical protein